ncbi:MAG TPA: glycogen debranching enzyme, partial [Spirochaetales bacterium]|nr:glycogen debranching enzyme [Spirochaetales bacterium]
CISLRVYSKNSFCEHHEFFEYTRKLIQFRKEHPALHRPEFFTGKDGNYNALPDIAWFGPNGLPPDWADPRGLLAARLDGSLADIMADRDDNDFFFAFNNSDADVAFVVCPAPAGKRWFDVLDTARPLPCSFIVHHERMPIVPQNSFILAARSMRMLVSRLP